MNNENQSLEVKTKNITLGLIVGWALGVLSLLAGFVYLFSKPLAGIAYLLIAIVVLPPINNVLQSKIHFSFSRGVKIVIVIILLFVAGSSMGLSGNNITNITVGTTGSSVSSPVVQLVSVIKVTAMKLSEDYKANEIAADAKYKGNTLEVSGTISDIGTDVLNTPYVTFNTGEYSFLGVQCMFGESDSPVLAKLSKGQALTVRGSVEGGGKVMNVLLNNCQIVK